MSDATAEVDRCRCGVGRYGCDVLVAKGGRCCAWCLHLGPTSHSTLDAPPEFVCPACGAVTRARMADVGRIHG
jgi:hypothetical protein